MPALLRRTPQVLAFLATSGLGISLYLTISHWGKKAILCGGIGQCDYVNTSEYANVGGVPVSFLGILLYAGLLGAAVLWALDETDDRRPIIYWGMALAGVGYAGYLTYVELEILHAICVWCVVSASILILSLVLSTANLLAPEPEERTLEESAGVRPRRDPAGRPRRVEPR